MKFVLYFIDAIIFLAFVVYIIFYISTQKYIFKISEISKFKYALVLGAGLERNGKPSEILVDRLMTAVDLFHAQKVDYLVMSGSTRENYNEPEAMISAARGYGVPDTVLFSDGYGNSTLDSCINLKKNYSPSSVLIISQNFHLPRALLLQRLLGVEAFGIAAQNHHFSIIKKSYWNLREVFALPYNLLKYSLFLIKR